jgi:hypothetical protein
MNQLNQQQILPLKQNEIDLIVLMRTKYRFGTIEVQMRDGLPQALLKTVERTNLGKGFSTDDVDQSNRVFYNPN